MKLLSVEKLSHYYGRSPALQELTFSLKPKEVVGLLGVNGAGKTTLIRILTGLVTPSEGTLLFFNEALTRPRIRKKFFRSLGYLPETPPLYPDLTVSEYLRFCCGLKRLGHPASECERVSRALALEKKSGARLGTLSKGYSQRVGLAAALLGKPPLLILDEPFVGLDPKQLRLMRRVIKNAQRSSAILFSSHLLSEVEQLATKMLVLHNGQKLFWGSPHLTLSRSKVFSLSFTLLLSSFIPSKEEIENFLRRTATAFKLTWEAAEWKALAVLNPPQLRFTVKLGQKNFSTKARLEFVSAVNYWLVKKRCGVAELRETTPSLEAFFLHLMDSKTESAPAVLRSG